MNPQKIWKRIFKEKPFNLNSFRQLNTRLVKTLQKYLILEKIESDKLEKQRIWAKILKERNIVHEYIKEAEKLINQISQNAKNIDSQHNLYLLEACRDLWTHSGTKRYVPEEPYMVLTHRYLDDYFLTLKLEGMAEWENRKEMLNEKIQSLFDEPLQNLIENGNENWTEFQKMYREIILLNRNGDKQLFLKLKDRLINPTERTNTQYRNILMRYLSNFVSFEVRNNTENSAEYEKHLFEIQKAAIRYNFFFEAEKVYEFTPIVNAARVAVWAKEFELAKDIVQYSKDFLANSADYGFCENLIDLEILWEEEKYEEAETIMVKLFTTTQAGTPRYELSLRKTEIKILYEICSKNQTEINRERLIRQIKNFQRYLRTREGFSHKRMKPYISFASLVLKLANLANEIGRRKAKKLKKIKDEIKSTEKLISSEWLLEKAEKI